MPAWLTELGGVDWSGLRALLEPLTNDWMMMLFVVTTVFLSGALRGFVGFGASLVIVIVLSIVVGPPAAVAIAGLSGLGPGLQLLPTAMRHAERAFVLPFCLMAFLIAPIGTWVLVVTDPAIMKMLISVFVLVMVWMLYLDWKPAAVEGPTMLITVGAVAGFVQGSAGMGGPPAVAVALARTAPPVRQRANVIGATIALSVSGLLPLWYNGVFTWQIVFFSVIATPFYVLGTWLGSYLFGRHGHRFFRNAALLALAVVGVITFVLASTDYFNLG